MTRYKVNDVDYIFIPDADAPVGNGSVFVYSVVQPANGTDFIVAIPAGIQPPDGNYQVTPTIGTPNTFTGISTDFVSQTSSQFRVTTDGELPDGTILLFTVQELS